MRRTVACIALTAAAVLPASGLADRWGIDPDYAGQFVGDPPAKVRFEVVDGDGGAKRRVLFSAEGVKVQCDNGKVKRTNVRPRYVRFVSGRVFYRRRFLEDPDTGDSALVEVRGRLMPGGVAEGYFFLDQTRLKPPRPPRPVIPECDTAGRLEWSANKIG